MRSARLPPTTVRHWIASLCLGLLATLAMAAEPAPKLQLVNDVYPPFVLEKNNPLGEGIDIEIAREALRRGGGYEIEVTLVPWKRVLHMLQIGEADLTTTITRTDERETFLDWSRGYRASTTYSFYTSTASNIRTMNDLNGKTLGVTRGYKYPEKITSIPNVVLDESNSIEGTLKKLAAGRVNAIVINGAVGQWKINRLGLTERIGKPAFTFVNPDKSPTLMAFSKKRNPSPALQAMNRGLAEMIRDGSLQKIERKYLSQ
jgi:polar amino acid transport system substrate-binding protein